jgi:hypothetical protein
MKVTRVQYTVRAEFVEDNRRNIAAVMRQLRAVGGNDVKYAVYLQQDGRTFTHVVHQNTTEAEQFPTSLESFKTFQAQLKSNLEVPPKVEALDLVESSAPIF